MKEVERFLYACSNEEKDDVIKELVYRFSISEENAKKIYISWRNRFVNESIPNEFKDIRQINFVKKKNNDDLPNLIESIDEIGICATAKKFKVSAKKLLRIYFKVKEGEVVGSFRGTSKCV